MYGKRFGYGVLMLALASALGVPVQDADAHGGGEQPWDSFIVRGGMGPPVLPSPGSFVNYETPHVHPLDINPSATFVAAVNTPDGFVEIFSVNGSGVLTHDRSIRVGYDPVTARFRTDDELWVVNQLSDTISVISLSQNQIIDTIHTYDGYDGSRAGDEPADVIFANLGYALVTGSRSDVVQRYTSSTGAYVDEFRLDGEDPRMLAKNVSGNNVYAAIFESGNGSTIIRGDNGPSAGFPPRDALTDMSNPYSGQNPPFNNGIPGTAWVADGMSVTPMTFQMAGSPPPPDVGLIVKKDASDVWRDDNGANWSPWVSGASAFMSGRFDGWDLMDNDVARLVSTNSFTTASYATRLMNHVMAVGVNPVSGEVFSVGTDATNEIRFEPNITGTFTRVMLGITSSGNVLQHLVDLNEEHLDAAQGGVGQAYSDHSVPQANRDDSIGDPRGIAFSLDGNFAYITGMGSNNVVVVNTGDGSRLGTNGEYTIEVGHGPTGIVHHPTLDRLYVLNKFDASITVINNATPGSDTIAQTVDFFDPTPEFINVGRVHLYGTHENSGLGQIACASCHIDSRMDRLAWDLGNPAGGTPIGTERILNTQDILSGNARVWNFIFGAGNQHGQPVHTMKGPMTTQTLQDIVRHEPFHWRGDRDGLEEFAGAFQGLQGDDAPLDSFSMQEFENFLGTIHFGPNPFRALDNSLPGGPQIVGAGTNPDLPLPDHFSPGAFTGKGGFSALGTPLPDGDAWQGFDDYLDAGLDGGIQCATCHALPMGSGPATTSNGTMIPPGPMGQRHIGLVDNDGTGQPHIKVPQTRNQFDKEGFYLNLGDVSAGGNADLAVSRAGFGLVHDGVVDGLARFLAEPVFATLNDQDLADIVAFTLCINGGGYDDLFALGGGPMNPSPDGGPEQTAHAAVGHQVTIATSSPAMADQDRIDLLVALADSDATGLIAYGTVSASPASWVHVSGTGAGALFQPDDGGANVTLATIQSFATGGDTVTFMAVPTVSEDRMGVDRDEDLIANRVEDGQNTDPANPRDNLYVDAAHGGAQNGTPTEPYTTVANGIGNAQPSPGKQAFVHIAAGSYTEPGTYNTPISLTSQGGTVTIQ